MKSKFDPITESKEQGRKREQALEIHEDRIEEARRFRRGEKLDKELREGAEELGSEEETAWDERWE